MPLFAANLSMMYTEHGFLDRFAAAAADGFDAVEYLFPYEHATETLAAQLRTHCLTQILFNLPPGDWAAGERGLAALPGREEEFAQSVQTGLRYAKALDCRRVHAMAGVIPSGADRSEMRASYVANLRRAAETLAPYGIMLLIEPINWRDIPEYFLNRQDEAHAVVCEVGAPNLKVQMDLYHCQIVEGDLATKIRRYLQDAQYRGRVGHIQIAGVPERHEPNIGELNYEYLFALLDELDYEGFVGCEYRPCNGTSAGLGWLRRWKASNQ